MVNLLCERSDRLVPQRRRTAAVQSGWRDSQTVVLRFSFDLNADSSVCFASPFLREKFRRCQSPALTPKARK
ncbi:hypothetical protein NQZ68_027900 [Dissostichus eleginoides]|nr:hypothetical protein NQZ68_027900 [Dissostichus eleginoides]